tara:strand:- start:1759 stop:3060 length:1302 start_codon:yes stop_codon:yes gene_type:complete
MTDFKDDEWKMTPSHNIKSVEDFLNDTSSLVDDSSHDNFLKQDNSLEDSLSDWGISVPDIISTDTALQDEENEQSAEPEERNSILDHLGTGIVEEELEEKSETENSLPSADDLDYPDEATGEFELSSVTERDRSLLDEVDTSHGWKVDTDEPHEDQSEEKINEIEESSLSIVEESSSLDELEVTSVDDPSLPNENDLEYPDIDAIIKEASDEDDSEEASFSDELEEGKEIKSMLDGISSDDLPEDYKPRSQLTSLEELNNELDSFKGEPDLGFEISREMKKDLTEEIPTDVEADDFWAIDEFPSLSGKLESSGKEGTKATDIKAEFFNDTSDEEGEGQFKMKPSSTLSSINISDVGGSNSSAAVQSLNVDEIVEKVKEALAPQLEEVVKKLFSQKIEQVAWEVIPDLAENVIKKEVEEIAKQVYMSTNELKKE